ncbi:MAG: efflux RND transporter periplasmic adaptor subunit [Proteobacteria bacterium]|nr:efflux RND transporter periplasmic adaptor subunit [Pseudomonadota bacterium]
MIERPVRGPVVALFLATAFLSGCDEQKPPAMKQPPASVGFIEVQPRNVELTAELAGRVVPSLIAEVRPQVSGIIEKRKFVEGSEVKENDVLYEIADASYVAAQASARASLDRARAAQVAAQSRAARYDTLADRAVASQQDRETAIANAAQARADVASAEAALTNANINLGYTKVRAPISGRIGVSSLTEGALVTANQATALATIQKIDPVFVDVPQSATAILMTQSDVQAGRLKLNPAGMGMTLHLDNGQAYAQEGQVQFTDITVNQGTGTVNLRVVFRNPDRILLPNMFVRGVARIGVLENVILAPQRAVTRDPRGQATVYVIGDGNKIEPRILTTNRTQGADWIVEKGLNAGDRLVMDGFQRIRPGAVVNPVPFGAPAAAPAAANGQ